MWASVAFFMKMRVHCVWVCLRHRFVEVRTSSGYTPLHFAVASGSVPAIRVLCAYGAKLESSNTHCADDFWVSCSTYTTPLHLAATLGFTEVAMALLRHYADQAEEWAMSKGVATVSTEPPSSEVDTKGLHHTSDGGAETGASGVHTQGGTMFSRVSSTPTGEVSLPTTSTNAEFGPNGRSTTDGEGDCRASQAPAARRMRKVSSMASLTSDGITTTASLKRPLDPRRATDGKGRIPMQVGGGTLGGGAWAAWWRQHMELSWCTEMGGVGPGEL